MRMWCPGRSVQRRGRSGWPSSPWTAAWCSISAWTSLPASHRAAHVRKVSSAEIQQFSCFLSPSSPALRGVPVYCALLCYAGRAGDDCEHGEPGQLRGAGLPLAPGGGKPDQGYRCCSPLCCTVQLYEMCSLESESITRLFNIMSEYNQ